MINDSEVPTGGESGETNVNLVTVDKWLSGLSPGQRKLIGKVVLPDKVLEGFKNSPFMTDKTWKAELLSLAEGGDDKLLTFQKFAQGLMQEEPTDRGEDYSKEVNAWLDGYEPGQIKTIGQLVLSPDTQDVLNDNPNTIDSSWKAEILAMASSGDE